MKQKKYSYWISSGKFTLIQKFSTLAMGIVSFMLLTRMMGPGSFGVWGLFLVISSIIESSRLALIKNGFLRYYHQQNNEHHDALQAAAAKLSVIISLTLSVGIVVLASAIEAFFNAPGLSLLLYWYAVTLLFSIIFTHLEIILNARMNFRALCSMFIARQAVLLGGISVFYFTNLEISFLVLALIYLASLLAGSIMGLILSRKFVRMQFSGHDVWTRKLWRFGRYSFGNSLSSLLFRSVDTFMTASLISVPVSGLYNASLRISNLVDMPSQAMGDMLFPKVAKYNSTDKAAIKNMYEKAVAATLTFSAPALLILFLFPELILRLLAGNAFTIAAPVLQIAALFSLTLPFLKQFGVIMDAIGHPETNFKLMFSAFFVNVLTNIGGIYVFGFLGAAIGTAITYFLLFIIAQIILNRKFNISLLEIFRKCLAFYPEFFQITLKKLRSSFS